MWWQKAILMLVVLSSLADSFSWALLGFLESFLVSQGKESRFTEWVFLKLKIQIKRQSFFFLYYTIFLLSLASIWIVAGWK